MLQALPFSYSVNLTSVDVPLDSRPGHYRVFLTVTMTAFHPNGTLSAQVRKFRCPSLGVSMPGVGQPARGHLACLLRRTISSTLLKS